MPHITVLLFILMFSQVAASITENHLHSFSHVILVVHNIDGPGLKSRSSQSSLASLASAKHIHMIASVDTVSAPSGKAHNYKIIKKLIIVQHGVCHWTMSLAGCGTM